MSVYIFPVIKVLRSPNILNDNELFKSTFEKLDIHTLRIG